MSAETRGGAAANRESKIENRTWGAFLSALKFVRFSHTIFAMPFALGGMLVAGGGLPPVRVFVLVVLAMVFARTAAMCFNRVVDWEIDKRNPRTADRHTLMPRGVAIVLLILNSAAFVATSWGINRLCLWLSPVALGLVFFYSLTKRFTSFSHFFLGLALSVSPVGAWLAIRGQFAFAPLVLALGVLLWVAGFDMIYATLDVEFDRGAGLHSWAVRTGVDGALRWAMAVHAVAFGVLGWFGIVASLGTAYWIALGVVAVALAYEHRIAARRNVGAVNAAFFQANAVVGIAFVVGIFVDQALLR
jgi:4-hydroxybenzoate polyprenyltransferase